MGSTNYEELAVLELIEHDLRRIATYLERLADELAPVPKYDAPGPVKMTFTE